VLDRAAEEEVLRQGAARRGRLERRPSAGGGEDWYRTDRVPLKDESGETTAVVVCLSRIEGMEVPDLAEGDEEDSVDAAVGAELSPRREALNLARLVEGSESSLRCGLPAQVDLDLRVTAQVLPCVGDADLLARVLRQLVGNAAEALGPAGGLITVRCGRRAFTTARLAQLAGGGDLAAGDYLFVEVSDPGCGMADEVAAHAFDPLFSTKLGGRGMGLTVVQRIVRAHGGAVGVETAPRMGSTFSVLLPVGKAQGGPKGCIADLMSSRGAGVARPRLKRS